MPQISGCNQFDILVLMIGDYSQILQCITFLFVAVDARRCYATGRGIQPKGIRVNDNADFKVHTEGAGVGELKVQIIGPGGIDVPVT